MLARASIAYVSNGEADERSDLYDRVLDLKENGAWTLTTAGSTSSR